jgi:putative NIF3 family GTP cyclohydrolase 1 type 2
MKLSAMYAAAVSRGVATDPRGQKGIDRILAENRKIYDELTEDRRWEFDMESLSNPFSDTRILVGDPDLEIQSVLVGIDIGVGEVLLAERLRDKGRPIDLVLAHHPEGRALTDLQAVMGVQADIWRRHGVPINLGDALMAERREEITRRFHADNAQQAIDAARLLDVPLMCCHTPADNSVSAFLQAYFDDLDEDATVDEVVAALKAIPEYREGVRLGAGPRAFTGNASTRVGKVMVDMTGGTEGPIDALDRLVDAGVGTVVSMHFSEEHRKRADALHLNVVVAGHHASDSLGMNLVCDEYEKAGIEVLACSGFMRHSRA